MDSDKTSQDLLESMGFIVNKLPEQDRPEADFLAQYDGQTFLIESKLKTDSPEAIKSQKTDLLAGRVHIHPDKFGNFKQLGRDTVPNAVRQIKSSAEHHPHNFKFITILCHGINYVTKKEKALDQIYGRTRLLATDTNQYKDCFYFRHSEFHKYKDVLDGAIIGYASQCGNGIEVNINICLNSYSRNYQLLKRSQFIQDHKNSVIDPLELEKNGHAYIPDADVPRYRDKMSSEEANRLSIPKELRGKEYTVYRHPMMDHLCKKYEKILIKLDWEASELSMIMQDI